MCHCDRKDSMDKLIVITGTNASGKSGLGVELAKRFDGEIVSADSRQVFTGLDLGSGKITKEEMQGIPHYMIDVAAPNDFFSLKDYQTGAYAAIDDIIDRGKSPFLVGGTGLYINSVVDGYNLTDAKPDLEIRKKIEAMSREDIIAHLEGVNPDALKSVDILNKRRLERALEKSLAGYSHDNESIPKYEVLEIGVTWPREVLYERIRIRLDKRLNEGMIDEVKSLRENGATDDFLFKLGLEYRYILMYLRGDFSDYDAFYNKLFMEIRHLAKEQMTWFRKRKNIKWIDMEDNPEDAATRLIEGFLTVPDGGIYEFKRQT